MGMTNYVQLDDPLYQAAMPLLEAIESHGYEAYFVGGCVRDTLLGKAIHDIDIATSATPDEIEAIFPLTFDVGKKHGTIVVVHQKENYEITTFRTEGTYSDYRRPDQVHFVRNLEEDTLRRDFTVNALALNRKGEVFDYHGGRLDLAAGIIRAVGIAHDRFDEDALRMMRALRFASQLGFRIEAATFAAIQQLAHRIAKVSVERIRIELSKLLAGDDLQATYPKFIDSGLGHYMIGFESCKETELWATTYQRLAPLIEAGVARDERLVWYALVMALQLTPGQARHFLRQWKHSNQLIQDVLELMGLERDLVAQQLDEWALYQASFPVIQLFDAYAYYQGWLAEKGSLLETKAGLPIQDRSQLALNGNQLMQALGLTRGHAGLGRLLQVLEAQVVRGQILNQTEALLERGCELGVDRHDR